MKSRHHLYWIGSTVICLLLGCNRSSSRPPPKAKTAIEIPKMGAAAHSGFVVTFAGPTGEVAPESEIQILFSRPLRALTTLADAPTPDVRMRPSIPGQWRWLGTQAMVFSPAQQRLPFGTEIEVEIPAETRALDGTRLGDPVQFTLRTPPPKLVNATSTDDANHLRENSQFELVFDQPVSPARLRSHLRLEVIRDTSTQSIPFTIAPSRAVEAGLGFHLTPGRPLPRASQVRLVVARDLAGLEGPLGTPEEQVQTFATISPLRIEKLDCDHSLPHQACDARSGLDLEFNNPISVRTLRAQLTLDGKRVRLADWYSDDETNAYFHLPGPFRPGTKVTLRANPGIRDEYGQSLAQAFAQQVVFGDLLPKADLGLEGDVFETTQPTAVPIGLVNIEQYDRLQVPLSVEAVARISQIESAADWFGHGLTLSGSKLEHLQSKHPRNGLGIESFEPTGPSRGPILLGVRYLSQARDGNPTTEQAARIIQRTNLGISAQLGRHAAVVWATELDSGHAVADAEILLVDGNAAVRAKGNTDEQGLARFGPGIISEKMLQESAPESLVIVARRGEDMAFRRIADLLPEWRIPVTVDRSGQLGKRTLLFTERGLYRPGERVDVKAIVREEQARGLSLPKREPIRLELWSPDNHAVANRTIQTSEFGTLSTRFALPLSAMTGQWSIRASSGTTPIGSTDLTVGEYRPVELEVDVTPEKNSMIRGGELGLRVRAKTLFGMPAAQAKTRLEIYRERTQYSPPGTENYVTDADAYDDLHREGSFRRAQLLLAQRQLDAAGRLEQSVSMALPGARGPQWVHCEAEVSDASQNPVTSSAKVLVHPADYYVALRRLRDAWVATPGRVGIDVAAFGIDGARVQGRAVELQLVRHRWSVVRREVNGSIETTNEPSEDTIGHCQIKTALTDQRCWFDVAQAGNYFVVGRAIDDAKREISASQQFFAVGSGQPEVADEDPHAIELVPDKSEYAVGEVAKILVKSVVTNGDALVVVGRSDLYSAERRPLAGSTPIIEVPIRDDMRPNAYVMVDLVSGRKRPPPTKIDEPDLGAPTYRMGWTELKIGHQDRQLTVEIRPSTRSARPGAAIQIGLSVKDAAAQPQRSEVTLWAVDEGVLALGKYRVPDPYQTFLGSRPLQLLPLESRESIGRRTLQAMREELGLTKGTPGSGGGESGEGTLVRKDFRSTAFFLPDLVTDAKGEASATLNLPDSLTSYRIFAVAVTGTDQYGYATDRIVTNKPLMVRPTLPRFLRDGDRAELSVELRSLEALEGNATVELKTTGMAPERQRQAVTLTKGGATELFFPITASGDGATSIAVDAQLGAAKDSAKLTRPLRAANPTQVVSQSGETTDRALERLGDLTEVRQDRGQLDLRLSSSFMAGAAGGFEQLVEYPYGCTEQVASRLLALLPLAGLARSAGIELPKDRERIVETAIAELLQRQRGDGGFGMWAGADRSEAWATAHALSALHQAKSNRPAVTTAVERAIEYLRNRAAQIGDLSNDPLGMAELAYVENVLFRMGQGDPAIINQLFAQRSRLPLFAQALLLHALVLSQHDRGAVDQLLKQVEPFVHQDGALARIVSNVGDDYARLFDSNVRTAAMVTWALAAARQDHPLLVPLARGLLAERRNGAWKNTQEAAFALLALDAVQRAKHLESNGIKASVRFGEQTVFSGKIGGAAPPLVTRSVGMSALHQGNAALLFETEAGPLLYEARLQYVPKRPAVTPLDSGFALQRSFAPIGLDGKLGAPLNAEVGVGDPNGTCVIRAKRGQNLLVELSVVVPRPREFVVVDAPLAAGFEAVDSAWHSSSEWVRRLDQIEVLGKRESVDLGMHRDLRDDRVAFMIDHFPIGLYRLRHLVRATTKGKFALPPARVEAMYNPEHFGTTSACVVEID